MHISLQSKINLGSGTPNLTSTAADMITSQFWAFLSVLVCCKSSTPEYLKKPDGPQGAGSHFRKIGVLNLDNLQPKKNVFIP